MSFDGKMLLPGLPFAQIGDEKAPTCAIAC